MTLQFGDAATIQQVKQEEKMAEIADTVTALIVQHCNTLTAGQLGEAFGVGISLGFFEADMSDWQAFVRRMSVELG